MKRKLLLLNTALVLLLAYSGGELRQEWLAARARETAGLNRKVKPAPPPPFTPLPMASPATPASYADIAQRMLFDRSRNPTVVIEAPKTEPPKPKPVPPLPVYHGQMNLGDGPVAIFSETPASPHHALHPGDVIGQFKVLDVNQDEIAFEWDGNTIRKRIDELLKRTVVEQEAAPPPVRTEAPVAAAPPAPAAASPSGPGNDNGNGTRACALNDGVPNGAVVDGFRKVLTPTPFGNLCRWDPVGR